jgi:hypothetical protein
MRGTKFYCMGLAVAAAMLAANAAMAQSAGPTPPATSQATPEAAPTPSAAKPKAAKPKAAKAKTSKLPFVTVTVKNSRSVPLLELTAMVSGGAGDAVKVAGNLGPGKKTTARLAHDKACLFDLHGQFSDGQTMEENGVELCKDKMINLTD